MKQKYILGIYDNLINDIKYEDYTNETEIISFLKSCSKESYYIHQIHFSKQKGNINYSFKKKLHNLHPYAPKFIPTDRDIYPEYKEAIPLLLKELNIHDSNIDHCWTTLNKKNSLIIREYCTIEELSSDNRFFLYCYNFAKKTNNKIKETHKEKVYGLKTKEKTEHYIHQKQYALENLYYGLIKDINPTIPKDIYNLSEDCNKIDCLKITYIYLEKLLIFIENEYRNFLDVNTQVPYRTLLVKEFEIMDKLNLVQSRLLEMKINDDLRKMAFIPLLKMATTNIKEKITYCEFHYCTKYIEELSRKFEHKKKAEESDIKEWLYDLNYNSLDFFDFETDHISSCVVKLESDIEKIGKLYQLLKSYNQRPTRSYTHFNQNLPSIKEQLINWIDEEIEYLTRKNKLESNSNISQSTVKIMTCFSVAQLSYFFSLLVKCGILQPKNHSDIFRFICNNFKTNKTDKIAYESVKKNYYTAELSVVNFIRSKIIELLNFTKY